MVDLEAGIAKPNSWMTLPLLAAMNQFLRLSEVCFPSLQMGLSPAPLLNCCRDPMRQCEGSKTVCHMSGLDSELWEISPASVHRELHPYILWATICSWCSYSFIIFVNTYTHNATPFSLCMQPSQFTIAATVHRTLIPDSNNQII